MSNPVEAYLDEQGITYTKYEFPFTIEGETARLKADELAIPIHQIFKTLVLKGNKTGPVIAMVPLEARLDYKKTAKATGNRKIGFPPMDYVLETTGYPHGANTPIGIKLQHPDYLQIFDTSIHELEEVLVSSGELGHSVKIKVSDLLAVIQPLEADLLAD